jgi:hypothetical protein
MRTFLAVILTVGTALAFDVQCHVACPKGYYEGCVKYSEKCYCTCQKDSEDAKEDILKSLDRFDASSELKERVRSILQHRENLPKTTITDPDTQKHFTIFLKRLSEDQLH